MPRFSVVVPSTDRPGLLPGAVRSALASSFQDFELVVSDNFSKLPASEILQAMPDPRIRVLRTDRRMPVADHWEFFWPHLRGDFVIILGDDNALHPRALSIADAAIRHHGLELLAWRAATYFHPDWNIAFPGLPDRGNVLGFVPGTTERWYLCDPVAVLQNFAAELRFSACFPCMLTCVFPREHAEAVRRRAGRLFWAPNPDVVVSTFVLGTLGGRAGFYDGHLAVGGRSVDSNLASWLSRGTRSKRIEQFVTEHGPDGLMPHHTPKFVTYTNTMAAAISVAQHCFPAEFAACGYDDRTLALRTIDDMYAPGIVPWVQDEAFLAEVEQFFQSLPPATRAGVLAYRDQHRREFMARETAGATAGGDAMGTIEREETWEEGGSRYVDMTTFGTSDIAGATAKLAAVLSRHDTRGSTLVDHYRGIGLLGEALPGVNWLTQLREWGAGKLAGKQDPAGPA